MRGDERTTLDTLLPGGSNVAGLAGPNLRVSGFTFDTTGLVTVRAEDVAVRFTAPLTDPLPDAAGAVDVHLQRERARRRDAVV